MLNKDSISDIKLFNYSEELIEWFQDGRNITLDNNIIMNKDFINTIVDNNISLNDEWIKQLSEFYTNISDYNEQLFTFLYEKKDYNIEFLSDNLMKFNDISKIEYYLNLSKNINNDTDDKYINRILKLFSNKRKSLEKASFPEDSTNINFIKYFKS